MTDASRPEENPYSPPPAGEPVLPPEPASQETSVPPAYQPPAAQAPDQPQADPQAAQPPVYPGAPVYPAAPTYPGAPDAGQAQPPAVKNQAKISSIISLVAGFVSIFLLPYIAGVLGIGLGVNAIRANNAARTTGAGYNGAYTGMAIGGIVLGVIGVILKIVVDIILR